MKFVNYQVVFQEVPEEISLAINISNCPCLCKGCHSSYLAEDIGDELNEDTLDLLINQNKGITCVAFMGGDSSPTKVDKYAKYVKSTYNLKTAWYSGRDYISDLINLSNFDFIKIGSYIEHLGPLKSITTNQRMYKVVNNKLEDITYKFWKDYV